MFCTATRPRLPSTHLAAPIAPRWSRPSGGKNAHRGLAGSCRAALAPTRSQALIASGKKVRCVRTARRTPLLPQGNQQKWTPPANSLICDKAGLLCDSSPPPTGPCNDLSSPGCQQCVNNYLNSTYGNVGGFVASTFNAQQSIPGLSGLSLSDTFAPGLEIGATKLGASNLLQNVGNSIAMNTSGPGGIWAGTSIEYGGAVLPEVLAVVGAATTPFATYALSFARTACGGG